MARQKSGLFTRKTDRSTGAERLAGKASPKKKTGATVCGSRFLDGISCQLQLESELQPELDLPVSINCTNCGGDVLEVTVCHIVCS